MCHAELIKGLADWATAFGKPLRIVDLGCSDASLATNAFRGANVEHYLGIDLSESSIERAAGNVALWQGRSELICGNLADVMAQQADRSINTALGSYSLHHFSTKQKLQLIDEVWRILTPGGVLLWIDAVRNNDENREQYIDRLTHAMLHDWTGLTPEQRTRGVEHVRTSDFPETKSWMLEHVAAAGFQRDGTLLENEFFGGWMFVKP
jgi:ubiquinone/menaquinone biosynthesis C-methylase UbiE